MNVKDVSILAIFEELSKFVIFCSIYVIGEHKCYKIGTKVTNKTKRTGHKAVLLFVSRCPSEVLLETFGEI